MMRSLLPFERVVRDVFTFFWAVWGGNQPTHHFGSFWQLISSTIRHKYWLTTAVRLVGVVTLVIVSRVIGLIGLVRRFTLVRVVKVVSWIKVFRLIRVVWVVKVIRVLRASGWSEWSRRSGWSGLSGWSTSPQSEMAVLALAFAQKGPHILPPLPGEARVRSILPTTRHKGLVDNREGVAASTFDKSQSWDEEQEEGLKCLFFLVN